MSDETMDTLAGSTPPATEGLNAETRRIWNTNAAFWDERMGDGNQFQRLLVGPATERLLEVRPGEEVLEIACGNGVMARRLAELGARVLATDFSAVFVERARERGAPGPGSVGYRVVDATSEAELLALGAGRFDAAVCTMALMDMAEIAPLFRALRRLLKPGGRFVFSLQHPCFNSGLFRMTAEEEDVNGEIVDVYAVKVIDYIHPRAQKGIGIVGQPEPHYYFHRPLTALLGACFAAGFVMDGIEEPVVPPGETSPRALSWAHFTSIPPVLVARVRPMG